MYRPVYKSPTCSVFPAGNEVRLLPASMLLDHFDDASEVTGWKESRDATRGRLRGSRMWGCPQLVSVHQLGQALTRRERPR